MSGDDERIDEVEVPAGESAVSTAVLPGKLPLRDAAMTEEELAALLEGAIQGLGDRQGLDIAALKAVLAKIRGVEGIQVHAIVGHTPAARDGRAGRTLTDNAVAAVLQRIAIELAGIREAAATTLPKAGQPAESATPSGMQPLVAELQRAGAGQRDAAQQAVAAMRGIADQIARSVTAYTESNKTTLQAIAAAGATSTAEILPVTRDAVSGDRAGRVPLAIALLLLCWAAVLSLKTGDQALALGSLVLANLLCCCPFLRRRC